MAQQSRWVLTDVANRVWVESIDLGPKELGLPADSGARIRKYTLRGGLSDGVDVLEVNNGALSFTVLPTRGMNIWRADYRGLPVGWQSPVHGPVHPKFVHAGDRGGLGWLTGFDELLARCGLESNGPPGTDMVPVPGGEPVPVALGLHGRISNLPAHYVEVRVAKGRTPELIVTGAVDESGFLCPQLRLLTEMTTELGSDTVRISDRVVNLKSTKAEAQLLYHWNFGAPILGQGARLSLPASRTLPRDPRAVLDIDAWDVYQGPTPGYAEQVHWHVPLGGARGDSLAVLRSAAGDCGVALRFNMKQLPCFVQWKQTGGESDGYVTGLEPSTNYPNPKSFERRHGRVVKLEPGAEFRSDLALQVLKGKPAVAGALAEVEKIQGRRAHEVGRAPEPQFSPCNE